MNAPAPHPVVTLDGTSGSGKSTLAQRISAALGWSVLDTGTLYRALAWGALNAGVEDLASSTDVLAAMPATHFQPNARGASILVIEGLADRAVLTRDAVSDAASRVAALPEVRKALLALQRDAALAGPIVAEGRDCGTVIFPHALVKFFVSADLEARGLRRAAQLGTEAPEAAERLAQRDARDESRASAPLERPKDAIDIDTTSTTVDACTAFAVAKIRERLERAR